MRISTQLMYQQTMGHVSDAQNSWLRSGESLSTGKKIITPSDDPIAASQVVVISQSEAQNDQYGVARTFATQRESLEDSVLQQVVVAVQSALEKVVQAGNGTLSNEDRQSLAMNLSGISDQLMNLANSTDGNGRYIFAGYKTDQPPFIREEVPVTDPDTGVAKTDDDGKPVTTSVVNYRGGDLSITQKVDAARVMVIGHTGDKVFGGGDGSVFNQLNTIVAALNKPVLTEEDGNTLNAAVDNANSALHHALDNVGDVRAEVGVQLQELQDLDNLGAQRTIDLKNQRSSLEDVDWNKTISDYRLKMYTLSAAYQAFNDMKGLSLFQMN